MIRRRVLHVLALLADAEDRRAVRRAAYPAISPVIRGSVRKRVERAMSAAYLEAIEADEAHVHRLAYLAVAGLPDDAHLGVAAVKARFDEARRGVSAPSKHGPSAVGLALLLVACGVAGGVVWWQTRPLEALRGSTAETSDAWTRGGRPRAGTPEQRALFEDVLPDWVVALDRVHQSRARNDDRTPDPQSVEALAASTSNLLSRAESALGRDTTSFLHALTDQAEELVLGRSMPAPDSHLRSIDAFVGVLADQGLGYYVDAELMVRRDGKPGARVLMSTYVVEDVAFYYSGDDRVRVLTLTRLDSLSFGRSVLGYTREQVSDALVLQARIETHLVDFLLPSLGQDARMPLVDHESTRGEEWPSEVEAAAGADARTAALAIAGPEGQRLGDVLQRRRALLDTWSERFVGSLVIARPRGFDFDVNLYRGIESRIPRAEWRELESIASELEDAALRRAYRVLEEAFSASVERHEVQHRLDFVSGAMHHATPLLDALGATTHEDGTRNERSWKRRTELSAYLSELARSPDLAHINLALFSRHLFHRSGWGTAESSSMLLIFEGLARHLGLEHEPLVRRRRVDRSALAELYLAIRRNEATALAAAAGDAWTEFLRGAASAPSPRRAPADLSAAALKA